MSNQRKNLLQPNRLLIASQTKTRNAEASNAQLVKIIEGLIRETRDVLFRIRPHLAPEGLAIADEFAKALDPPAVIEPSKLPGRGKAPIQVFTAEELKAVGE